MADHSSMRKPFIVEEPTTKKRIYLLYRSYEDFLQKCKDKFSIPEDEEVNFEIAEYNAEVDEDAIETLKDETLLVVRRINEMSCSATHEQPFQDDMQGSTDIYRRDMDTKEQGDMPSSIAISSRSMDTIKQGEEEANKVIALYGKNKDKAVEMVTKSLEELNSMPLAVAVIGSSGNGKSTIINVMREVNDKTQKAAVGTTETTTECTPYPHPKHPNIVFWDIPGVGTSSFPRNEYLSKIKVEMYDFFLICSCTRFTEDDTWLAGKILGLSKRFYFLRTKIDQDIKNAQYDKGDDFNQEEEIRTIRDSCMTGLPEGTPLFLVSSRRPREFDFPALMERLILDAPYEKKYAVVMGLVVTNKKHIKQKAEYLRANIWKHVFLSLLSGLAIQHLQCKIIASTISSYKEELQLTEEDICRFSSLCGLSVKELKIKADLKMETTAKMQCYLPGIRETTVEGAMIMKPILFLHVASYLGMLLETYESDALKLFDLVAKRQLQLP